MSKRHAMQMASLGVGAPVALATTLLALNNFLAPSKSHRRPPTFEHLPAHTGAPRRVILGLHGLWEPSFGNLREFMQTEGEVVLATNGCHVEDTAPMAIDELRRLGLDSHETMTIGFSLGTQTAVQCMRTYRQIMGRPLDRAILVSGMADTPDVIWPNRYLPYAARLLRPGPIAQSVWSQYWAHTLRVMNAAGASPETMSRVESRSRLHVGAALSGAQLLAHGIRLQPGEFDGTKVLIIEHPSDHRVRSCFERWQIAAPDSTLHTISGPGHASFDEYLDEYTKIIAEWLRTT